MTIIRCPRCRDEVSVPPRATSRALVRCPLCLEQYLLAEAMSNAPPALVIIGGEVAQEAIAAPTTEDEYRLAGGPVATPEYHPGRVAAANAAAAARPALRAGPRPRPRQSNPILLIANYVGGGVMGLALGLLVLWWGFKRDPLELGPTFAAYVPWIVPAEFHGKPAAPAEPSGRELSAITPRAKKAERPRDEPLQSLPAFEVGDQPTGPGLIAPGVTQPTLTPTIETPLLTDPTADRSTNAPADSNVVDPASATATESEAPSAAPVPDLTSLLPEDWPTRVLEPDRRREFLAAADLTDAISQSGGSLTRYQGTATSGGDWKEAFVQLHADLGEIGRLLSYREPGQTGLSEPIGEVEKMLEKIAGDEQALAQLQTLTAEHWPDMADGRGLFAMGTVKEMQSAGELYSMLLHLEDGKTMPIATATNPEDLCQVGDRLFVIGRIVEEPKINLPGYEGELTKVLVSGFSYRLSK
jgi:hypothetical protein